MPSSPCAVPRLLDHRQLEPRRLLAAGDLDATFGGGDGKALYPFTPFTGPSIGYDVAVQADGKFIAIGSIDPGATGKGDFVITRFNVDGRRTSDSAISGSRRSTSAAMRMSRAGCSSTAREVS